MKTIKNFAIGFSFICFAFSSFAAVPPLKPVYLSYEEASRLALDGNPDLAAVRAQEGAFKLRAKQALAPNNPVISYNGNDTPGFDPTIQPAQAVYQINFTLGFPGKALAQSANLEHQAEATRELAISKEVDLLVALSNNYISFSINDTFYHFLTDEQKRGAKLLKILEKKYAASQAAKVDILNAKVVSAQIDQDLLSNRNDYEVFLTQFRQLIKKPEHNEMYPQVPKEIVVPPLNKTFEQLSHLMLKNMHLLRAADHQVEAAQSNLTLASLQPFPDFQLMTAINTWNSPPGAPIPGVLRDYTFGIGIAVPIFFPFNELTGIKAARQDMANADYQSQSQRLQSIANLQTTYTGLQAAQKALKSLETLVVPAAKASYDLELLTYSLGKSDFFRLNDTRKSWFDSKRALLSQRQIEAQLFNQFIQNVGCDFSKKEGPHACVE